MSRVSICNEKDDKVNRQRLGGDGGKRQRSQRHRGRREKGAKSTGLKTGHYRGGQEAQLEDSGRL
jgi:hypothetical protein